MSIYNFEQIEFNKLQHFNSFVTAIDNSSFHWHYEYELIHVLEGSLTVYMNPEPVLLKKGDLLLINSKTVHSMTRTEERNSCLILEIHPDLFQMEAEANVSYRFHLNSANGKIPADWDRKDFIKTACRLTLLYMQKERKNFHRLKALVYRIIADLFDYVPYDMTFHSPSYSDDSSRVMEILDYIENNLQSDDVLDQLCCEMGLSGKSLYRFLKDHIGLSAKELEELKVKLHMEQAVSKEIFESSEYDVHIVGTGATPINIKLQGSETNNVYNAVEVSMDKSKAGERIAIIGAGLVGAELGLWLAQEGKQVTIVEMTPQILGGPKAMPFPNYDMLKDLLNHHNIEILTETAAESVTAEGLVVRNNGEEKLIPADTIISAVGYRSDNSLFKEMSTETDKEMYILGDAKNVHNIMYAVWDAYEVARTV